MKDINGLMKHLRDSGISISPNQKKLLIKTGYYHGYKGYRFYKNASVRLPFNSYKEIYATIEFDTKLKSLLFGKIMLIETALKNYALMYILNEVKSESIRDFLAKAVYSYKNSPYSVSDQQKKKYQEKKLRLELQIQGALRNAYMKENPKITHFYNSARYIDVPLWALFEIITLGELGFLLSCLTYDVRNSISKELGLNLSTDTNRELIYRYPYLLKDLRNAIAHNNVIYDARFRTFLPPRSTKQCLIQDFQFRYINFETLGDYIILITYFLKLLGENKSENMAFVKSFEKLTTTYIKDVNPNVTVVTIHKELLIRMKHLQSQL